MNTASASRASVCLHSVRFRKGENCSRELESVEKLERQIGGPLGVRVFFLGTSFAVPLLHANNSDAPWILEQHARVTAEQRVINVRHGYSVTHRRPWNSLDDVLYASPLNGMVFQ
jgi:hypothetical protein